MNSPRIKKLQNLHAIDIPDALLKIGTVSEVTGYSPPSIYKKVAKNEFPAPIKMGLRCTRWRAADVTTWLRSKVAA